MKRARGIIDPSPLGDRCMHRHWAGTCQMTLHLETQGPWFVFGAKAPEQPATPLYGTGNRPVLPASSLKGVLRSCAGRILRGMQPDRSVDLPPLADIPFVRTKAERETFAERDRRDIADSDLVAWRDAVDLPALQPSGVYRELSPASQLFGATVHAGLLTLEDAYPAAPAVRAPRPHVALDRFSGGVALGPFSDNLPAGAETLVTTLTISNFALWHIALLALVFQELGRGYQRIGGGGHKGQGHVKASVPCLTVRYPERVYGNLTGGIVSAQARLDLLGEPLEAIPPQVQPERELDPLLPHLPAEPAGDADWRQAATKTVRVQGDDVTLLFRTVVTEAWLPWLEREIMRQPHETPHG